MTNINIIIIVIADEESLIIDVNIISIKFIKDHICSRLIDLNSAKLNNHVKINIINYLRGTTVS